MPDQFSTSIISELAKLRIRIDSIPNHPLRDAYESEYEAKHIELVNAIPANLRHKIDEWIDEEIELQRLKKRNP